MSMTKILITAALAVASGLVLAAPAQAAQGGNDQNGDPHVWIKMGAKEFQPNGSVVGADRACTNIFGNGYSGFRPCDHLVPDLVNQRLSNRNANGYWAEYYYKSGRDNAGTW